MLCECPVCRGKARNWALIRIQLGTDSEGKKWEDKTQGALVFGPLAIIHSSSYPFWGITHIPTGFCVESGFLEYREARQALKEILALNLNWDFIDPPKVPNSTRQAMADWERTWQSEKST
jgi:hypothetical protein